jgi:iron complex outermembrane receptor protein
VYRIDFNNEIFSQKIGANTDFYNGGGTRYKGIEGTATYYLGMGLSVYANGSINSAKDDTTGQWVVQAPTATAAGGLIYNLNGIYASLIDKWVGSTYWANPSGVQNAVTQQALPSYNVLNAAIGYTFADSHGWWKDAKVTVDLSNLLNNTSVYAVAGGTAAAGTPLYWTIPQRSFNVNLSVPIR